MNDFGPDCTDCGTDLYVNAVERPNVDWVKVVCSKCGYVSTISMIRLGQKKRRAEGIDLPGGDKSQGDTS
jgi:DNA-directed RNA polymerase subunit M/transcription elongation factor TFIIS